jgi:hypothetical protein
MKDEGGKGAGTTYSPERVTLTIDSSNLSLPKAFVGESLPRSCFEISFKLDRALVVLKTDIRNDLPRTVFGRMGRSAGIVRLEGAH